jgi:hypothetical protein
LGYYYWDPNHHRQQSDDDGDIIRINNQGAYVWKDADSAVSAFLGIDIAVEPQKTNPNCITNAVEGGTLSVRPSNNIEADPNGGNRHDGPHVVVPFGTRRPVTALPEMAGVVDHAGPQSSVDQKYSVVYIILNTHFQNQNLVLSLVDMEFRTGLNRKGQQVIPGHRIGFADNYNGNEGGLHVTLMLRSTYTQYIQNRWGNAARHRVPVSLLIDAARDPRSPFRCP